MKQEYFFVSAGLQSILNNFIKDYGEDSLTDLPKYVAVHINDTHPAMCVAEMMRLLVDRYRMDWDEAWEVTKQVMSYTNHTIMAEAMEKWDVGMFSQLCRGSLTSSRKLTAATWLAWKARFPVT